MGLFGSLFDKRKKTTTQEPMLTKEQLDAQSLLLDFAKTGRTPTGYQAGEAYDLSGFNFSPTGVETQGMAALSNLLSGGEASGIGTARDVLTGLATAEFSPDDASTGFGAFKSRLDREIKEASDVLNREAAITGSRYGTQIGREKTDLAERQGDIIAGTLADLFNAQQNRALKAATGLAGLESGAQAMEQARIASAFGFGGLQRDLQNQQAQLEYNERQRQRDEQLQSVGALQNLFNRNVPFGIKSVTTEQPSVFSQIYGQINPFVGSYNQARYGTQGQATIGDMLKLFMSGGTGGFGGGPGAAGAV